MSVTLKINGQEDFSTNYPLITFGRRADNTVPLNDPNVSQYHARIEQREDGYWLVEQGSSNGTSVNGNEIESEMLLENGDKILLGGSSEIVFNLDNAKGADEELLEMDAAEPEASATETTEEKKGNSTLMMVAGGLVGLAVITVVVAGAVIWGGSGKCEATARIKGPESGDVLKESTEIIADVRQKTPCVGKVVLLLDGKEVGSADSAPYKISLDAQSFGGLDDGLDHKLTLVLLDAENKVIPQAGDEIALAFDTLETPTPTVTPNPNPSTQPTQNTPQNKQVTVIETQDMLRKLLQKNFPNAPGYKLNQEFLIAVNKKLAEYVSEGYYERAGKYKDTVNVVFVEQNLGAPLGYLLAMSRSKFINQKQGENEGLWQISPKLLAENNIVLGQYCGTETLSDDSQKCSARIAALYLQAIILNIFEGDIIYGIAAIGMSPADAGAFKSGLPANRVDFWNIIKSPKQREEVVKFFAAGIVAENPERFGLKTDLPLSKLFPVQADPVSKLFSISNQPEG